MPRKTASKTRTAAQPTGGLGRPRKLRTAENAEKICKLIEDGYTFSLEPDADGVADLVLVCEPGG